MSKSLRMVAAVCLVLGALTAVWIVYDLFLLATDLDGVLLGDRGLIVGISYLVMLLLHGAAFILILMVFALHRGYGGFKTGSIALLVVSLVMIAVQKVMYDEVGREMGIGSEVPGELAFVYTGLLVNALFCLVVVGLSLFALRSPSAEAALDKGAPIFTLAQWMGVVSGLLGLLLTLSLTARQVPAGRLWVFVPFYLLFLVPYATTAFFWLVVKRRERAGPWYDEKQLRDLMLAALTTLLLLVPALTVFLLVPDATGVYWYPYALFVMLTLFSGSTLYYYRCR